MADNTPLATYHNNFRLAFWPDRERAVDLLPHTPEAGAAGVSNSDESQRSMPVVSVREDAGLRLPRPGPLGFLFFSGACLPR